jgi:hypothetical protein
VRLSLLATQLKRGRWQSPPPKQIGPGATAELSVVGSYFIDLKAAYARYGVERVIDGKWLGAGDLGLFVVNDRISMPGHNPADSISIAQARLSVASGLNYYDRYKLFILPNQNWRPS